MLNAECRNRKNVEFDIPVRHPAFVIWH